MPPSMQLKDHWQEQRLFLSRIIAAAVVVLLLTGAVVSRLVQLQIFQNERFLELSQGNRLRIEPMPPTRGLIYDRNGIVIAENRPQWELVAVGEQIDNLDRTLGALEELGLVDPSERTTLRDLIRSHRGFERVKLSNLTEEQAATFAVRRHLFSGVDIQEARSRYYPFGELTAHANGYVGSISTQDLERIERSNYAGTSHIGKTGVERYGELIVFRAAANAFLQHMVRNIVGSLVYVGQGKHPPSWLGELLASRNRGLAAPTFAPEGLYLTAVEYDSAWGLTWSQPREPRMIA
jgi:penicillin-binding protein 2